MTWEAVYRHLCRAGLVVAASMLLWGCAPGKGPFLIVQMCLGNKEGIAEFIDELKAIAAAEKMSFTDRSSHTKRELEATGYSSPERTGDSPVINIGLIGKDGLGIGAGNLGLPGYQVAWVSRELRTPSRVRSLSLGVKRNGPNASRSMGEMDLFSTIVGLSTGSGVWAKWPLWTLAPFHGGFLLRLRALEQVEG